MSQIMTGRIFFFLLVFTVTVAAGCGTQNDKSAFDADSQSHAASWLPSGHASVAQANLASCRECHGDDLQGGISGVSCAACHPDGLTALTGCTSCHASPPAGNAAPNRRGRHAVHDALPEVADACGSCHFGAGSGSTLHFNDAADVLFPAMYSAKSGTAVRNADGTCSAVSCHGGQTTPSWTTGAIDVNTQCDSCHAFGSGEYNSFASGQHAVHVLSFGFPCSRCHDTARLASLHFTNLTTTALEGPASATLLSSLSFTVTDLGPRCTPICHSPQPW